MRAAQADIGPAATASTVIDAATADALAKRIAAGGDAPIEINFPRLLQYYRDQKDGFAAAQLAFKVLAVYNRRGYYHEAKSLLPVIMPHFDQLAGGDQATRMSFVSEINSCLVATGDGEQALQTVKTLAAPHITQPHLLANLNYIFAMHHLRYLEAKDTASAEQHLMLAKDNLSAAGDLPMAGEHEFLKAFIDNGLAFLRVRQKRHHEALDLCRTAYDAVTGRVGRGPPSPASVRSAIQHGAGACPTGSTGAGSSLLPEGDRHGSRTTPNTMPRAAASWSNSSVTRRPSTNTRRRWNTARPIPASISEGGLPCPTAGMVGRTGLLRHLP